MCAIHNLRRPPEMTRSAYSSSLKVTPRSALNHQLSRRKRIYCEVPLNDLLLSMRMIQASALRSSY
jgi:hypothetical protein